jgi:hypothetical protein
VGANIDRTKTAGPIISRLISTVPRNSAFEKTVLQLRGPDHNADQTIGVVVATNVSISAAQEAVKTWSMAKCMTGAETAVNITDNQIYIAGPLTIPRNSTFNATTIDNKKRHNRRGRVALGPRADCSTEPVILGDGCAALASRCGITAATFTNYNTKTDLCSTLQEGQLVCCSSGTLPNRTPTQNADGSCLALSTPFKRMIRAPKLLQTSILLKPT